MAENRELALVLKLVADQFQSELKKSGGALQDFNSFIKDWKTQVVAAAGALFAIAKTTANYGEELLKNSQKLGINIQALAGLQHAANIADLSTEQLTQGIKFLSINMVEAKRQTGDGEALFRRLGISATDAAGNLLPVQDVLLEVADAFANSNDGAGKAEAAVKLFGKAGLDLIPFLNQGKAGIQELMKEAEKLGLVRSEKDAQAANTFNDELKKMVAQLKGITFAIGKELIPVLSEFMKLLRTMGVGPAFSFGMEMIHDRLVGLNVLFKELAANAMFLKGLNPFSDEKGMSLDELKKRIDDIEAEGKRKQFEFKHPGVLSPPEGGAPGGKPGTEKKKKDIAESVDQEKLAKKLQDIWASQNRALEIRNKLMREQAEGLTEEQLGFDRREQFRQEDEAAEEAKGRRIVDATQLQVRLREEASRREKEALAENAQAWLDYQASTSTTTEARYAKEIQLLEANIALELNIEVEQAAALLDAWTKHEDQKAEMILNSVVKTEREKESVQLRSMKRVVEANRRASGDVVEGWKRGMEEYVEQTGNGFNLATDMARRTAQMMEAGFRTFFFDIMDNRIQSFKDVLRSMLDFAKQIVAQIIAQLATAAILKAFLGPTVPTAPTGLTISSPAPATSVQVAGGGALARRFANGGPVMGFGTSDTVPALLTPGEFVLSRADVGDIKRGFASGNRSPINIGITVNAGEGGMKQGGKGGKANNFEKLAQDLTRLVEAKLIDEQRPGGLLAGGA
jgi:hypothetical protein